MEVLDNLTDKQAVLEKGLVAGKAFEIRQLISQILT
jgi:hypothetical protein